jgi:hypothetical protein
VTQAIYTNETTTPLGASATFSSPARVVGEVGRLAWVYWTAYVIADQAGTLNLQGSLDGTTWRTLATVALAANVGQTLTTRCTFPQMRAQVVNGATPQALLVLNTQASVE